MGFGLVQFKLVVESYRYVDHHDYVFPIQFVLGPIHEYMRAYQTAYGFQTKAVDSNQMGQLLWRGPSWWMAGSASLVSSLYCYQNSELFDNLDEWWDWESLSRDLNQRQENYTQAGRTITDGIPTMIGKCWKKIVSLK